MTAQTAMLPVRRQRRHHAAARTRGAIIDIGSNSIRLVVYAGPTRIPTIMYNEKVLAGLGRGLAENGRISDESMALARPALARFAALCREMEVDDLRCVATAAVRDAENGGEFLDIAKALGLKVELLSGEDEAVAAGHGVLAAIPDADGIVGDLGGGSLELARVHDGEVHERASFPLGVLRIGKLRAKGKRTLEKRVSKMIGDAGWKHAGAGRPLYMVGGSWRALARLDMHLNQYPLPVIHGYRMDRDAIERLRRTIAHISKGRLRDIPNLSSGRIATLSEAGALLSVLMDQLRIDEVLVSAFGLREGLFHQGLDPEERDRDPLLVMAHEEARTLGRFPDHGDLLHDWIAPLFGEEQDRYLRLRHAACLLADVGWRANPEFRAERGLEVALHGNWVAIDGWGRALLAQALFTAFGGGMSSPEPLVQLAPYDDLERAKKWGLAIRLGQRWSGGVAGPLERSRLAGDDTMLSLNIGKADRDLYSDTVERRHKALAAAMNREARLSGL